MDTTIPIEMINLLNYLEELIEYKQESGQNDLVLETFVKNIKDERSLTVDPFDTLPDKKTFHDIWKIKKQFTPFGVSFTEP